MRHDFFSSELNDLLEEKPAWWMRNGNFIVIAFIIALLCASLMISVSNTEKHAVFLISVNGTNELVVKNKPSDFFSGKNGMVYLYGWQQAFKGEFRKSDFNYAYITHEKKLVQGKLNKKVGYIRVVNRESLAKKLFGFLF